MIAYLLSASQVGVSSQSTNMEQMGSMLVSLFIVLAVAIALAWLWKKVMPQSLLNSRGMDVIASHHLGNRERIIIINVGERYLLLGVTPQSIQTLAEFKAEELPDALLSMKKDPLQRWQLWQNRKS